MGDFKSPFYFINTLCFNVKKLFIGKYIVHKMGKIVVNKHVDNKAQVSSENFVNKGEIVISNQVGGEGVFIVNKNNDPIFIGPFTGEGGGGGGNGESTTKGENGFIIQFNEKVYDNETIYVYSDSGCTTLIGSFMAKYGVLEYTLDAVMSMSRSTTLFSSGLFGTNSTDTSDSSTEMANIIKLEYEILVSKVNQLMKLLKNKK